MMKFRHKFVFDSFWIQILSAFIAIMFVSHLIIFIIMTKNSQATQTAVNRGLIMRQMLTLVEAVAINPPDKRMDVIRNVNLPNIEITASKKPQWGLHVNSPNIWLVIKKLKTLPTNYRVLRVSVKFGPNSWLNISGYIETIQLWKLQFFLFLLELVIVLALAFAIWAANHYNKSLRNFVTDIEKITRQIGYGSLNEGNGPEAVKQAAHAVNKMQKRIGQIIQTRTQILAAISHDLRTPLTRLKLRCQFMEDETLRNKMLQDLDEMEAMIKESLAYSKDEHHQFEMTDIDLASVIYNTCNGYQETGKQVMYSGPPKGFKITGNQLALKRAFSNIIDNGLKYGNKVDVYLRYLDDQFKIIFDDYGQGIPESERENVFRPFYRIEKSRSRSTGGTGLGLAAARSIILAHGGEVTLDSNKNEGLRVEVKI